MKLLAPFILCYIVQGLVTGFRSTALLNWLLEAGVSTERLTSAFAVFALPWSAKFILGPLVDHARQRGTSPWRIVFVAQAAVLVGALALLAVPDAHDLLWLAGPLFLMSLATALQDVSVDALAVDIIPSALRGKAQAAMNIASGLGMAAGGGAFAALLARKGLTTSALTLAAATGVLTLLVYALRPTQRLATAPAGLSAWTIVTSAVRACLDRQSSLPAFLGFAHTTGLSALRFGIGAVLVQKLGWTSEAWSGLSVGVVTTGMIGGYLLGGFLGDKLGATRVITWSTVTSVAAALALAFVSDSWGDKNVMVPLFGLALFASSATIVVLASMYMTVAAEGPVAATHIACLMATLNLGLAVGEMACGWWLKLGPAWVAALGYAIIVAVALAILRVFNARPSVVETRAVAA